MRRLTPQQIPRLFRALAWAFGVTGALFFLFPDGTVRIVNGLGRALGSFPPLPTSPLRFWVGLAVAYMALVTLLAALTARDVVRYRPIMPILAASSAVSATTCLYYYLARDPAFLYLLNVLVGGALALLVLVAHRTVVAVPVPAGGAPRSGDTTHRHPERQLLEVVLATMLPSGGSFPAGAPDCSLTDEVHRYFARAHPRGLAGLRVILWVLELGPYLFFRPRRRFTQLEPDMRERYLAGFERSRFRWRRQILASLKLIAMLHFYEWPAAAGAVGYDGSYLKEKLLTGPNARGHRERLDQEAAATGTGDC